MTGAVIANQWTGFYVITASVMKELNKMITKIRKNRNSLQSIKVQSLSDALFLSSLIH